jgi:DNA-binding MarR family transcriptional regulator
MDGGQLHRLGRRLIELSRQATGEPGDLTLTPGEADVLEDVIMHPDSSVSDIARRTGFAQSHVSVSVARLTERVLVTTASDPADGRRTRVRVGVDALAAITRRADRSVDDVLGQAVDRARADEVSTLLGRLAELLL